MDMANADRALAEHREATMPEILARNAEYEALPEVVKLRALVAHLQGNLARVWNVARTMPEGKERGALLDLSEMAFNIPVWFALTLKEAA